MSDLEIRRATPDDLPALLALLRASMRRDDDTRFETLFRWKHLDNAYGQSPMWVACDADTVVGLRVFMRWEFDAPGRIVRAVRAVDTATHPDYQGRGVFTRLTLGGLDDLAAEGVQFVFNTPNASSRPGYLKMGWHELGRAPAALRPTRFAALPALLGARAAAEHWSIPVAAGVAASTLLRDEELAAGLLARDEAPQGALRTRFDPSVLRWRFGLDDLAYRAVTDDLDTGVAFVRVRRRGDAREAAIALTLAPSRRARRRLLAAVREQLRPHADYLLTIGPSPGFVPVRRLGPVVTARRVAETPPATVREFGFTLGDIELF